MTAKSENPLPRPHSLPEAALHGGVQSLPPRRLRILGIPLDLGQSRRGVDMGPSAVRVAGLQARLQLLGHTVTDGGNVGVHQPETRRVGEEHSRYVHEIAETCGDAAQRVIKILEDGITPVILGGDHSLAVGTVSGIAEFYRRREQKIGLVWIDAHSDMNTPETSPSGNVHGMPLAALLGLGPTPLSNLPVGRPKLRQSIRRLSACATSTPPRRKTSAAPALPGVYTMRDIDEWGMRAVIEEALAVAGKGTAGYHVSLDMDWVDPEMHPASVRRYAAARLTAKPISRWRVWPSMAGC